MISTNFIIFSVLHGNKSLYLFETGSSLSPPSASSFSFLTSSFLLALPCLQVQTVESESDFWRWLEKGFVSLLTVSFSLSTQDEQYYDEIFFYLPRDGAYSIDYSQSLGEGGEVTSTKLT